MLPLKLYKPGLQLLPLSQHSSSTSSPNRSLSSEDSEAFPSTMLSKSSTIVPRKTVRFLTETSHSLVPMSALLRLLLWGWGKLSKTSLKEEIIQFTGYCQWRGTKTGTDGKKQFWKELTQKAWGYRLTELMFHSLLNLLCYTAQDDLTKDAIAYSRIDPPKPLLVQ